MSQISLEQRKLLEIMRQEDTDFRNIKSFGDEISIPRRTGNYIRALIYKPQSVSSKIPVFFNLHGGGFVRGCPEKEDIFCKKLSESLGIAVINVDYRLAPEFPFPQGLNDAYDSVDYVYKNFIKFGIDPSRME